VRALLTPVSQMLMMGAIVATMLYWPLGIVVALVLVLCDVPLGPIATFGGTFNTFLGLLAWWLLAFVGASIYAACAFPWGDSVPAWPAKKSL
jgi:hypothetical protein